MKRPLLSTFKIIFLILGSFIITSQVLSQDTVIENGDHSDAVVNEALKDTNAVEKKEPSNNSTIPSPTPTNNPNVENKPQETPKEELTKADELSSFLQQGAGKTKLRLNKGSGDPTDDLRLELENFLRQANKLPAKKQAFHQLVSLTLEEVRKIPESELDKNLFGKIENPTLKEVLDNNPKHKIFFKELIKDKTALVELSKILDDFNLIVKFLTVMVLTFFVGFMVDRFFKHDKRSTFGKVNVFFFKIFFMLGLRLSVIYFFFGENLRPAFELALKVYNN